MLTLTAPQTGSTFAAGSSIELVALPSRPVRSVTFYANGVQVGTVDSAKPYARVFAQMLAGTYEIRAMAIDRNKTVEWATPITITAEAAAPEPTLVPEPLPTPSPGPVPPQPTPVPTPDSPPPPTPDSPPSVPTGSLTAANLQYLGSFLLPQDNPTAGTRFGYSNGILACRRVAGELRLFITGASPKVDGDYFREGDSPYEITYPGVSLDPATRPRAALVRNWRDIYGGRRLLNDTAQGAIVRGLHYDNGILYWAYGSFYAVAGWHDPSIGASVLNDGTGASTPFGPWRTQEHSQRTKGYFMGIPASFQATVGGKTLAVGAPITSGNATCLRGAGLYGLSTFDPTTLPASPLVPDGSWALDCQRLIHHDTDHPQARPGSYKICGWNVLYDCAQGAWLQQGELNFNNAGIGLDHFGSAIWCETPSLSGVVYFGAMTDRIPGMTYPSDSDPHLWYGPENVKCCHGQTGYGAGTGPHTASHVPIICTFSPTDMAAVVAGTKQPWELTPTSFQQLQSLLPITVPMREIAYALGGAAWDATDRLLFVSEINQEVIGEPRPIVHVLQVPA